MAVILNITALSNEYHVSKTGNDKNPGTLESPYYTIQAAANIAQPGDIIVVYKGVYRERITPPRGGESDSKRITYRAAAGEKVHIKGSEQINNWEQFKGSVWKATIPNSFFKNYNPYSDEVKGDWFSNMGRAHHTGEVYLNGKSLWEMEMLEKVLNPKAAKDKFDPEGSTYTWYCEVDEANTYIYANFHGFNPNEELVEINVRKACFYPDSNNINYITISGFEMSQAATQWAPPTSEQIGLIGTNWSKGWIIENNIIRNSKCSGITLGKYGDEFDNSSADSAEGYVGTIQRALARDWSKENIGSHIIRNNVISDCEQTGICGSMGGIFSTIENNDIYNIWTKRMWNGAEMGGIKIHASIDMFIKNNRVVNCDKGLWFDWMCQGARITGNLLYNNVTDLFMEVNHGPYFVENNIFLSRLCINDWNQGGAYAHNLFAGNIQMKPQKRVTPFHLAHSTELGGMHDIKGGDNRYFNNIFIGGVPEQHRNKSGLGTYNNAELPMVVDGNVYLNSASEYRDEKNKLVLELNPNMKMEEKESGIYLTINIDKQILKFKNQTVTSELLGKSIIPDQPFVNPDGSEITVSKDYFGKEKSKKNPTAGPFEKPETGEVTFKIWHK